MTNLSKIIKHIFFLIVLAFGTRVNVKSGEWPD
jgi:hypothetical protein